MEQVLKYGDKIILFKNTKAPEGHNAVELSDRLIGNNGGIVSSIGFAERSVYFQEFPQGISESDEAEKIGCDWEGLQDSVFILTPKLNFDFQKEFNKTQHYYISLQSSLNNAGSIRETERNAEESTLLANLVERMEKLKIRIKKEEEQNKSLMDKCNGKPVLLGDEVHLLHSNSGYFIKAGKYFTHSKTSGHICELSKVASSSSVFQLKSRFRGRLLGDAIHFHEEVAFFNVKHNSTLHCSSNLPTQVDISDELQANPFLLPTSAYDPTLRRFLVYLSEENESFFKVIIYRRNQLDENLYLMGGDIIKITHTEMQADLTATISHNVDGVPEVYFRSYDGEYKEEQNSLASYWVVEYPELEEAGRIICLDSDTNHIHRETKPLRLRHLISGRCITKLGVDEMNTFQLGLQEKGGINEEGYSLFHLDQVIRNSEELLNGQLYFITEVETNTFLKDSREHSIKQDNRSLMNRLKEIDPDYEFYPLEDADRGGENKLIAVLSKEVTSQDAFIIQRISEDERREIFFVRSLLPILQSLQTPFIKRKEELITVDYIESATKVMQTIIVFLFDLDPNQSHNYFEIEDMPSERKQKQLREYGIIDLLVHIIYVPFSSGLLHLQTMQSTHPLIRVLEMSYTTIRYAIKEYRPNELFASQWMNLMMKQSLETTTENDIKAGQTLTELIDNNQRILESRIETSTITSFIKILREKDKNAKYVNILRAICLCDGEPMIKNQKEISNELLEKEENRKSMITGASLDPVRGIVLHLRIPGFEDCPLSTLESESQNSKVDQGKTFEFVVSFIYLLSDLCKDRNYISIDYLQKTFTYDICYEIVSSIKYCYRIREAFMSLMIYLWLDISPLQERSVPCYVRVWQMTGDQATARQKSTESLDRHNQFKQFLFGYLKSLQGYSNTQEDIYNEEKQGFDLVILQATLKMLHLGIIEDFSQVNDILLSLEGFLTNFRASSVVDEDLDNVIDSEQEGSDKAIECKTIACQIILLGFKILNEHRIDELLKILPSSLDKFISETATVPFQSQVPGGALKKVNIENYSVAKQRQSAYNKVNETISTIISDKTPVSMNNTEKVFDILSNLIMSKSNSLRISAVQLLRFLFGQKRILGEIVSNLQILEDKKARDSLMRAREFSYTLDMFADTIERWYHNYQSKEISSLVTILNKLHSSLVLTKKYGQIDDDDGRIEGLSRPQVSAFQGRRPRPTATYLDLKAEGNLPDLYQFLVDSYEEKIQGIEQDLCYNTGIVDALIRMIDFDAKVIVPDERSFESSLIIKKIYRILTKLCYSHEHNKNLILPHFDSVVLCHFLQTNTDVNCSFLIEQVLQDNPNTILNETKVKKIATTLCKVAESLERDNVQKSFILYILGKLVSYKNLIIMKNQNFILSMIISKNFKTLSINFDTIFNSQEPESNSLETSKNKNIHKYLKTVSGRRVLVVPPDICYIIAYIQLLTQCSQSKNGFAENICQNQLGLDTLHKLISMADMFIVLKYTLLEYFFHTFLDTEKDIPFHALELFLSILKNLMDQFEYYAKKKFLEIEDNVESVDEFLILIHNSFKPFSVWVQEYILLLIDSFINVIRRNLNLISESEPARDYEKFIMALIDITQIALEKFPDERIGGPLIRLIREIYSKSASSDSIKDKLKEKHRILIDNKSFSTIGHNKDSLELHNPFEDRVQVVPTPANVSSKKYMDLTCEYLRSEEFKSVTEEEFREIVRELNKLNNISTGGKENNMLDRFFQSLIDFLEPTKDLEEVEVYLQSVKIFRIYLEGNSKGIPGPMSDWEGDEWKELIAEIYPKQERLIKLKVLDLCCKILQRIKSEEVILEVLLLMISLLTGGNILAQESFYELFMEDEDNHTLSSLKTILCDAFDQLTKNMKEHNSLLLKEFYASMENHQNQKEVLQSEIDHAYKLLKVRSDIEGVEINSEICKKTFRFLQLLCEGHNKNLQNLLRQQNHESPLASHKNINFVALTANIWGVFTKIVNPQCIELGESIINLIIELVQGPCEANQKEFFLYKIVDFSKDFINDFNSERHFDSRGFHRELKHLIDDLITGTIKMLNSLLEANSDMNMYRNIASNVKVEDLLNKLKLRFFSLFAEKEHLILDRHQPDGVAVLSQKQLRDLLNKIIDGKEKDVREAFEFFFLIQKVDDANPEEEKADMTRLIREDKRLKLAFRFFLRNSGHIEIKFRGDLQKVYFMIHPTCRFLDRGQKNEFLDTVNRDTPMEKLADFIEKHPGLFDKMEHFNRLNQKLGFIKEKSFWQVRDAAFLVATVINLYILFTFEKRVEKMDYVNQSIPATPYFLQIAGILNMFLGTLMTILWLILHSRMVILDGWRERSRAMMSYLESLPPEEKSSRFCLTSLGVQDHRTRTIQETVFPEL